MAGTATQIISAPGKRLKRLAFKRQKAYYYYFYIFDEVDHLAELGWFYFKQGQYEKLQIIMSAYLPAEKKIRIITITWLQLLGQPLRMQRSPSNISMPRLIMAGELETGQNKKRNSGFCIILRMGCCPEADECLKRNQNVYELQRHNFHRSKH